MLVPCDHGAQLHTDAHVCTFGQARARWFPLRSARCTMASPRRWLLTLLVATAACARRPAADQALRPDVNPRVISWTELQDPRIQSMDALRAIRSLRPAFFRPSGPQSFVNPRAGQVLYSMDFGPLRPVSELVTLTTALLVEIRYLDPTEAQNRFGLRADGGPVIVLLNNRAP
jgi:hypothetical protein